MMNNNPNQTHTTPASLMMQAPDNSTQSQAFRAFLNSPDSLGLPQPGNPDTTQKQKTNQLSLDDLTELEEQTIEKIVLELMAHLENNKLLLAEFQKKYPDLQGFEDYIALDIAQTIRNACQQSHVLPALSELVESGICSFMSRLKPMVDKQTQKQYEQLLNQKINRQVLQMDISGGQTPDKPNTADAIWNMPSDKFAEMDKALARKFYQ